MDFTEKEKQTVVAFDYQIFNNGIEDIYYNNYYREMFSYFDILSKEGSEISMEVSNMIKRAFILIIELDRFGQYKDPEYNMKDTITAWENELEKIQENYRLLSDDFLSKFHIKKIKGSLKPCYNF